MITSATAQAIMNTLWFGSSLGKSISDPILYVTPENTLSFESSFNKAVQRGLQEMGHQPKNNPYFFNVVQGVSQEGACLRGHSDVRKMARAAGY
ncbi:glutathione hydrolase 5 proenzyme-like [Ascaphus truei]|uniref:glutathione hydrolase 5 proenzyme-like n=1 Tax=Ascaphus truei TaxID=8439 RepID=UPI003F592E9A